MKQIQVRVPEWMFVLLDAEAHRRGVPRQVVIRRYLHAGLYADALRREREGE